MNIKLVSENIKNNIADFTAEQIQSQFIQFAELVLRQHMATEREEAKAQVRENLKNGGAVRPILVAYLGIGNMEGANVQQYIQQTSNALNSLIPQQEYITLVAPVRESETKFEVLSAEMLSDEQKSEFADKLQFIEDTFKENLKTGQ
jgi:hypothetical protein